MASCSVQPLSLCLSCSGCPPPCSLLSLLQVIQQNYDERADMWSAGIMMYQLLSGALTRRPQARRPCV